MQIVFSLVIFVITLLSEVNSKHICSSNTTINIEADKIEFLESLSFPRLIKENESCSFQFVKNETVEEKNKRFIMVITNYICLDHNGPPCDPQFAVYTDMLSPPPFYGSPNYAFQGFVLYDDWGDDCPLESISRVDPFQFSDETQILMLRSVYFNDDNRTHPCLWQFQAPDGYWIKVVFTHGSDRAVVTVKNSYETILRDNIKLNYPYYIRDTYLRIILSVINITNDYPNSYHDGFSAFVSIVKEAPVYTQSNCIIKLHDKNITIWSNYDIDKGYQPNSKCSYDCSIPPGTEIIVSKKKEFLEKYTEEFSFYETGVDYINIYLDGTINSAPLAYIDLTYNDVIVLSANDFNEDRHVLFEFKSDGSWESLGFEIEFEERECSCANPKIIVPCENSLSFNIMNSKDGHYCANLCCNFTIELEESCFEKNIKMALNFTDNRISTNEDELYDIFRVFSDNYTILEINHSNRYRNIFTAYMPPINTYIFQAITVPSILYQKLEIIFQAVNVQNVIDEITLTEETPYFYYDLCSNVPPNIFTLQLSPDLISKNSTIEIYSVINKMLNYIAFYTTSNLTTKMDIKNCFTPNTNNDYICKTFKTKFSVLQVTNVSQCSVLLFQASNVHNQGCVYHHNVFAMPEFESYETTILTNDKMPCTVFFIITQPFSLRKIWLSSQSKNISIYVGTKNEELIEISQKTAPIYHDIILYSYIYMCVIQPNSSVIFNFHPGPFVLILTHPFQSIIATRLYGEKYAVVEPEPFASEAGPTVECIVGAYSARFTVMNYNVTSDVQYFFWNLDTNEKINITSSLQNVTFTNTRVGLGLDCNGNMTCDGQFLIFVETFDNSESTTPMELISSSDPTTIASTTDVSAGLRHEFDKSVLTVSQIVFTFLIKNLFEL